VGRFGFSFSWKRAIGLSQAQGRLSRKLGITLSRGGLERKVGRAVLGGAGCAVLLACLAGALVSGLMVVVALMG
jgi:hypothetical protein